MRRVKWIFGVVFRWKYRSDHVNRYQAYDIWSIGVVWLEFIFGTPHVFELPSRTQARLDQDFKAFNMSEKDRDKLHLLRAMMEFCIYPPGSFVGQSKNLLLSLRNECMLFLDIERDVGSENECFSSVTVWLCTEESMFELLKSRDMHSVGIGSKSGLNLLMSLLEWNPFTRITAGKALQSRYFDIQHPKRQDA